MGVISASPVYVIPRDAVAKAGYGATGRLGCVEQGFTPSIVQQPTAHLMVKCHQNTNLTVSEKMYRTGKDYIK